MLRRSTMTAIKFVAGVLLGIVLYYGFESMTGPEWTDSVEILTGGCARQGMDTRFGIGEGALTHWECVDPESHGATSSEPGASMPSETGERVHVERAGVVAMALPFAEAFPLFSAEGERQWAAGWNPRYVYPGEPHAGEGLVFQTTRKGAGTATWIQTRHDPATGVASYVYVIPNHHTAMVDVQVAPDGESRSRASVQYRMTSLSSDADEFVRAFGEAFEDYMAHWAEAIQQHVVERVPLPRE